MTTLINATITHRFQGKYKLTVRRADGSIKQETEWFDNLITNMGLDQIATSNGSNGINATNAIAMAAYTGTGTTPPADTDTTMTAVLGTVYSNRTPFSNGTYVAGTPSYWSWIATYNFPAGSTTGNIAEVGVGDQIGALPMSTQYLFSHALVMVGGSPGTITVLSTEALTLTYELREYINATTQTGTMTISGTSYSLQWLPFLIGTSPNGKFTVGYAPNQMMGYNGSLGSITGIPSGSSGNSSGAITFSSYLLSNYYIDETWNFALADCNLTGGISAVTIQTMWHQYQIGFSPAIPKDNVHTLQMTIRVAWARYP